MAPSVKMAALVAALIVLSSAQAQGWATEAAVADMAPVSPAQRVTVVMPGGGGGGGVGTLAAPLCLQCRCCSRSNPVHCVATSCCSTFNCNTAGKCNFVQQKCGCSGCGGAN